MLCNIKSSRLAKLSYILASDPNIEDRLEGNNSGISPEDRALLQQLQQCGISLKKLLSQFTILGPNLNWWG